METKKRVLFVDDDAAVLAALRCLMHRERKRWDLVFASDGEEALRVLREQRVDVVVTDMRMPHMDGAMLLNHIKQEFPSTARIMLSGFAEPDAIARALPALHQLLSKPCEGPALRSTIERSIDATSGSWTALGSIDRLPTPTPSLAAAHQALDAGSLGELTRVVQQDPGLAAKVLQLASSDYFRNTDGEQVSIERGLSQLGIERLRYLRLAASIFAPAPDADASWLEVLRARSARGAQLVRHLVPHAADLAGTAALLRNAGRCVLAMEDVGYRADILRNPGVRGLFQIEHERFAGVTHSELGGWLLSLWGLPATITRLIQFHQKPDLAPPELREVACAVYVADAWVDGVDVDAIDRDSLARAGCGHRLEAWRETASRALDS